METATWEVCVVCILAQSTDSSVISRKGSGQAPAWSHSQPLNGNKTLDPVPTLQDTEALPAPPFFIYFSLPPEMKADEAHPKCGQTLLADEALAGV